MSGKPFDQTVFNTLEKPASSDWNAVGDNDSQTLRFLLAMLLAQRSTASDPAALLTSGFIGAGFYVQAPYGDMTVKINTGIGVYNNPADEPTNITAGPAGITGVTDLQPLKPLVLTQPKVVAINPADSSHPRWDLIEVRYNRVLTDYDNKFILNPSTGQFEPASVPKTLSWALDDVAQASDASTAINYKPGTPAASPTKPTPTSGYLPLCYIYVDTGATSLSGQGIIADMRQVVDLSGVIPFSAMANCDGGTGFTNVSFAVPPGWQFTAERGNQGDGDDHITTFWFFHPPLVSENYATNPGGPATALKRIAAVASTDIVDSFIVQGVTGGLVNSAIKAGIGGGWSAHLAATKSVCVGQPYTAIVVTSSSTIGGPRVVSVNATVPVRSFF